MINFGIIGYGKMGKIRHRAIRCTARGHVAKVFDVKPIGPNDLVGARQVLAYEDILNDPDIDAVVICTPNFLNKKLTIEALRAGKHVLCEKPPAFNAAEVREVIQVERLSRRKLMYGFNHRHHGAAVKMHEFVKDNTFGRILWMRGRYGKSVDEDYFNTWRADPRLAGGGILIDQGIHVLDLFLYIGGEFDVVHALVSNLYWNLPGIEDNVFAMFRNSQTGQCASLHSTMTQWRHLFSFEVFLERGYMVVNGLKTPSGTYGAEQLTVAMNRSKAPAAKWQREEQFQFDADESWDREMMLFCDTIDKDLPVLDGGSASALSVMTLIDRIYEHGVHHVDSLHSELQAQV